MNKYIKIGIVMTLVVAGLFVIGNKMKDSKTSCCGSVAGEISNHKVILVDFHASWCGTCKKQESVLKKIGKENEFSEVVIQTVDFDHATSLKKEHGVSKQSTLILFKNGKELARTVGISNEDEIKTFIRKAL